MWCSGFGGSFWDRRGPWSLPRPSLFGLVRFSPGSWVSGTRWVATCSWLGLLPLAPVVHLHTHRASAVVASVGGVPVRLKLRISWRASVVAWPFRLCAVFSGFVPLFSASCPLSAPKAVAVFSFRASCPFSACVPFSASVPPPCWPSGLLLYSPVHVPTSLYAGFPSGWRVALGWLARGSCCVSRCWSARCGGRFSLGLLLAWVGTAPLSA